MTLYHRLKVITLKTYRFFRYGMTVARPRTLNTIFLPASFAICDYCGMEGTCATLEADWEVVVTICGECLAKAQSYIGGKPTSIPFSHEGVIVR